VTLADIERFIIPRHVRSATEKALQSAGRDGYELFVLWTGVVTGCNFVARTAYVPSQSSFREDSELLVRVEGPALFKLNHWLYEHRQVLAAQVHTHPGRAYHSDTDDAFPIVTTLGGLSIVLPDFAVDGFGAPGAAGYRLDDTGWTPLPDDFVGRIVEFAD
jgi:hypothetical protein